MVADCGGGTVDITIHEVREDGTVGELYKAVGGPHGAVGKCIVGGLYNSVAVLHGAVGTCTVRDFTRLLVNLIASW